MNIHSVGVRSWVNFGVKIEETFVDGQGITYNYQQVSPAQEVPLDDDLILWLTEDFSNCFND